MIRFTLAGVLAENVEFGERLVAKTEAMLNILAGRECPSYLASSYATSERVIIKDSYRLLYTLLGFAAGGWTRRSSRKYMSTAIKAAESPVSLRERSWEASRLTNNGKRQIRPVQQHLLLLGAHPPGPHVPQVEAARRGAHGGDAAKRQAGELGGAGRRSPGREAVDEVGGEGQLDEALDVEEGLEPGLVGGGGVAGLEVGVARGGDVQGAQAEEEVQRGGGGAVERPGVEGDEVEGWGWVSRCASEVRDGGLPSMPTSWTPMMSR